MSSIYLTDSGRQRLDAHFASVILLKTTSSTNDVASQAPLGDGAILVASTRQESGRGRRGNRWVSAPGSLAFTVAVPWSGPMTRESGPLPLVAGLALATALEKMGVPVKLKWPNDLWIDEEKVGGILAEKHRQRILVGVGLNVASAPSLEPDCVPATFLQKHVGSKLSMELGDVLVSCAGALVEALFEFKRTRVFPRAEYLLCFPFLGQRVTMEHGSTVVEGTIVDVDEDGALVVQTETQSIRCQAGEVHHVRRRA